MGCLLLSGIVLLAVLSFLTALGIRKLSKDYDEDMPDLDGLMQTLDDVQRFTREHTAQAEAAAK